MKVAFASCSNATRSSQRSQPVWGIIRQQKPDLLLLLGDNVYIGKEGYDPEPRFGETSLEAKQRILISKYDAQLAEPHFKELLQEVPYLAVWDNHDFGLPGHKYKEGDITVKRYGGEVDDDHRDMVRVLFHRYLKRRSKRPEPEPVYCKFIHYEGNGKKIKFLMLDVRSRQTAPHPIGTKRGGTLLGEEQEKWLLDELELNEAEIHVICSGIPYAAGDGVGWGAYTSWFNAFNDKLLTTNRPLFLGGNIHNNAFEAHIKKTNSDGEVTITMARSKGGQDDQPVTTDEKYLFYEAVSSGVGQNFKDSENDQEEDGDDDGDDFIDDITEISADGIITGNDTLAGLPRNNYGIIDFTTELVKITLYSQKPKDNFYAEIDRKSWQLKKSWRQGVYIK